MYRTQLCCACGPRKKMHSGPLVVKAQSGVCLVGYGTRIVIVVSGCLVDIADIAGHFVTDLYCALHPIRPTPSDTDPLRYGR